MNALLVQAREAPLWAIYVFTVVGFATIYFGLGALTAWLTGHVFPALGVGRKLELRPVRPGQIGEEMRGSLRSIAIFGGYGVAAVGMDRVGWTHIVWNLDLVRLPAELLLLTLWNEVHFYGCHRLLHLPWLYRKVHHDHHRSVAPTPWSTFSFHWGEAVLLGSVMLPVLPLFDFSAPALVLFPVVSLTLNNLGHMNYDLVPDQGTWHPLAASRRHALHHAKVAWNLGFLLPFMDRALGTALPVHEGDKVLQRASKQSA
ncbi:sterol desaturase family protein [Archangium violaceum]|uniref:sterol desaturase family protein n=1 Tax=Archangium violaceum TaxID=83451 RepID=UPI002B2CA30B|nr:sterol desaturase family protein [Archangium gephyra]